MTKCTTIILAVLFSAHTAIGSVGVSYSVA